MAEPAARLVDEMPLDFAKHTLITEPPKPLEIAEATELRGLMDPAKTGKTIEANDKEPPKTSEMTGCTGPAERAKPNGLVTEPPSTSSTLDQNGIKEQSSRLLNDQEFDLVTGVSGFLKSIEPWKGIMPQQLLRQMENLQEQTRGLSKKDEPCSDDEDDKPRWDCTVKRMTMQDWSKPDYEILDWDNEKRLPHPIMKAYYRDTKSLQRVQIDSWILCEELARATSLVNVEDNPILIASPFKLLVSFMPQIEARLRELDIELEEAKTKLKTIETDTPAMGDQHDISSDAKNADSQKSIEKGADAENAAAQKIKSTKEANDADNAAAEKKQSIKEAKKSLKNIKERISQLQCYQDFIYSDLSDCLQLREQAANGNIKTIAFADLWHIFRPGDVLFSNKNGSEQISQVFHVAGGNCLRRNISSTEYDLQRSLGRRRRGPYDFDSSSDEDDDDHIALAAGTWTPFTIAYFSMGFDGAKIGPVGERHVIKHFEGEKRITDLDIFPVRFHDDQDALLQRMAQRGRKLLRDKGHKSYQGSARPVNSMPGSGSNIQSDVFIDPITYYRSYSRQRPTLGPRSISRSHEADFESQEAIPGRKTYTYRNLHGTEVDTKLAEDFFAGNISFLQPIVVSEDEVSTEHLHQLPSTAIGYIFQTREWCLLDVDLIQDIDHSDEARSSGWKDLIIPDKYREILVALVDSHASHEQIEADQGQLSMNSEGAPQAQIDLIRGKGQGLIILLHGPPGSGKTSTAETIASYTNRPLYSITCGDIGTTPSEVEMNLNDHLERAGKWGCVLLLDEADVFLEKRSWHDMQRNALVSVFLRILEYYSGILFLTTNRIGVIDEAFKSRIHIVLQYPRITLDSTKKMWHNILNRLELANKTSKVKTKFDREALIKFAEVHFLQQDSEDKRWNGRQIRNAFQSALALGRYDRVQMLREAPEAERNKKKYMTVKLSKANFKKIADTARDFENYISDLRGDDSYAAWGEETRNDFLDPDSEFSHVISPTRRNNRGLDPRSPASPSQSLKPPPGPPRKPSPGPPRIPAKSKLASARQKNQQRETLIANGPEDLSDDNLSSDGDDDDDEEEEEDD